MKRVRTAGILLLCLCVAFLTACSGSEADMTISVGKFTAAAGETVEIPVTVGEGSNIAATDIYLIFDSSKLDYVSYDDSETFSADGHIGNLEEEGKFHYAFITLSPLTEAGTIFTLTLQVAEGATGEIPITVEVPTLVNENGDTLSANIVNGSITVQ